MNRLVPSLPGVRHMVPDEVAILLLGNPEAVRPMGVIAVRKKGRRVTLVPAPAGKPPAGRNDPCPCGSGKKFKKCHRG